MYNYQDFRQWVTTGEDVQVRLIQMRDRAGRLFRMAGCATVGKLLAAGSGDSWEELALIDRLVELRAFYILKNLYGPRQDDICFPIGDWWRG